MIFGAKSQLTRWLKHLTRPRWRQRQARGPSSYPAVETSPSRHRPTRECDCLEVGIRSQVWQQFSNLCNFQEVPSPEDLEEADEDNEAITNGTMNLYTVRSSCFTVKVRPAGLDPNGREMTGAPSTTNS